MRAPSRPRFATRPPPEPLTAEAAKRFSRLRWIAWLLDRSIPIGGSWRIGLDPILGLLPGAGDWIGAVLSLYVFYEGARLGVPQRVLVRMAGNILIEAIVGIVPVVGDVFDFAWQANTRNLALIEEHYRPDLAPRSLRKLWLTLAVLSIAVLGSLGALVFFAVKGLLAVLGQA